LDLIFLKRKFYFWFLEYSFESPSFFFSFRRFSFSFNPQFGIMEYIFGAEQPMRAAIEKGDAKGLAELILQNPGFKFQDVSIIEGIKTLYFPSESGTLLHYACRSSSRSAVIPLLLAHPGIDANLKDIYGKTPFYCACEGGCTSCVREMLKDSRVKVNEPNNAGYTPLWFAARYGYLDVIKWWIASGREMDLGKPGDVGKTDAIGGAKKSGKKEVVTLLEKFKKDAAQTRQAMRVELGWYDEQADVRPGGLCLGWIAEN